MLHTPTPRCTGTHFPSFSTSSSPLLPRRIDKNSRPFATFSPFFPLSLAGSIPSPALILTVPRPLLRTTQPQTHTRVSFKSWSRVWGTSPSTLSSCSNQVVNLHLSTEQPSTNIPLTVQERVETQLIAAFAYSLFNFSFPSARASLQSAHEVSLHLNLCGRKNDESTPLLLFSHSGDVIECTLTDPALAASRFHHSVFTLLPFVSSLTLSIHDLSFLLDGRRGVEVLAAYFAAGLTKCLGTVDLSLLKLRLVYYNQSQWKQNAFSAKEIDFSEEIGVCSGCDSHE